jgi:hypothetical protein
LLNDPESQTKEACVVAATNANGGLLDERNSVAGFAQKYLSSEEEQPAQIIFAPVNDSDAVGNKENTGDQKAKF